MSKYYIPRDHVIRHVVIRDDTDESLAEETLEIYRPSELSRLADL